MENTEENDENQRKNISWSENRAINDAVFSDVRKIEREIDKRYEQRISQQEQSTPQEEKKEQKSLPDFELVKSSHASETDTNEIKKKTEEHFSPPVIGKEPVKSKQKIKKHIAIGKRKKKTKQTRIVKNPFSHYIERLIAALQKPTPSFKIQKKIVYLEETGERLGVVYSVIFDENNHVAGYEIKDNSSDAVLQFPIEQFTEDKRGLFLAPRWYVNAVKTIEKFEFKERASPELVHLFSEKIYAESNPVLFKEFDPEFTTCVQESKSLRELLRNQLLVYEQQRQKVNEALMDLTKKRLIEDIDRSSFSEAVMELRRKVKLLDITSTRCTELLQRLDATIFGKMSKNPPPAIQSERRLPPLEHAKDSPVQERDLYPASLDQKQASLTAIIAEFIEDKLTEDIKKQLIKNQLSSFEKINAYGEMQKQQESKEICIQTLQTELQQKNEMIKRLQEELLKK